jgi:hypothetical protein
VLYLAIYHPKIRFRGQTNYDLELIVGTFDPDNGAVDSYLDMEPVYTDSYDGSIRTDYGAKYSSVATPSITFIEVDGSDIGPYKVRNTLRWLTGSRGNAWMDVCDKDGDTVCSYLGRFTNVQLQKIDARVIGIIAQFTSVSPWAYSRVQAPVVINVNGETEFAIDNQSDDFYSYVYPKVTFENSSNGASLLIKNKTLNNETEFKNLQQGEKVTIDNNFVVYSDNDKRIFNDDFNFVFPMLSAGTNQFYAEGSGTLTIEFRYPMKVTDGLLNDYDLKDGLAIWVDGVTVKIKGDTTKNPPLWTNIQVEEHRKIHKMIVRGELKSVKFETGTDVENGVLTLEDNGSVCPFDEFDAEVVNGELIIKKSVRQVSIT